MSTNPYTSTELAARALSVQSRLLDLEHHGLVRKAARQQRTLDALCYQVAQDYPSRASKLLKELTEARTLAQNVHIDVDCSVCVAEDWRDTVTVAGLESVS